MHWSILCSAPHQIKSYARTDNPLCTSWSKKPSLFNWGAPCFDSKTCSLLPTSYLKAHFLSKFLGWSDTLEWLALISKRQSIGLPQIHSAEEFYTLPNLSQGLELFLTIYLSRHLVSFSKLNLIKNYLRSMMSQSHLSDLALLSIKNDAAKTVKFDQVIINFAALS